MAGLTTRLVCSIIKSVCRCGGTGRRKGLKIPRWQQRTGSIPVGGTESKRNARTLVFAFLFAFYVCQVLWLGRHKREMSAKLSAKNAWNGRQRDQNIPRFKGNLLVFFVWICALEKSITFVFFYFCPWLYFVIRTWRRKSCLRRCVCFLYQGAHRYWRWSNNWNVPARSAPLSWKHCFLEASWHKSALTV